MLCVSQDVVWGVLGGVLYVLVSGATAHCDYYFAIEHSDF